MKSINLILLIIQLFLSNKLFAQIEEDWPGYKVSIPFIKVLDIKPNLVPSKNQTNVYPPQTSYEVKGYIYKLELTISISGNKEDFKEQIPVVLKTPTNEEIIFTFNTDRNLLQSNRLYNFICELKLLQNGYIEIGLMRKFSNSPDPIVIYENGLRLE